MQTFKLLSNDSVLLSQPVLIEHFGRTGAQLLSQLHYWLSKKQDLGSIHNGVRWIYNSAKAWAAQICISERQIERILSRLQTLGVIQTKQLSRNKFDRTNHFTINYAVLERYIGSDTLEPSENSIPTKCRYRNRKNDGMYIQKLPNKDFNKSDRFSKNLEVIEQGSIKNSLSQEFCETEQVKQVKDLNLKNEKRLDALQETLTTCLTIKKNKADETNPLLLKTSTAQDMLKVWNNGFTGKAETKLSKDLAPLLVSAFKNKFESNLKNWQHYCDQLKSSPYLMGESFKLTLGWALKFGTIDRIRAGDLGVKFSPRDTSTGQGSIINETQIVQMIESLKESNQAKELRHKITKAIGCAAYYSWFHSSKFCEEGGEIRMIAPNPFVEMYWETNFDWVSKFVR